MNKKDFNKDQILFLKISLKKVIKELFYFQDFVMLIDNQ